MNNFYEPRFKVKPISKASGVPVATIRQWYVREIWTTGKYEQGSAGSGIARLVSAPTAIGYAITKALSDLGIPATRGVMAAKRFTHISAEKDRQPGKLFPKDETWLILCGEYDQVLNVGADTKAKDLTAAFPYSDDDQLPIVFLPLDDLVIRVVEALGFERDILWGES